jgi:hypothetical protein
MNLLSEPSKGNCNATHYILKRLTKGWQGRGPHVETCTGSRATGVSLQERDEAFFCIRK